jgi:hypothetical protein
MANKRPQPAPAQDGQPDDYRDWSRDVSHPPVIIITRTTP